MAKFRMPPTATDNNYHDLDRQPRKMPTIKELLERRESIQRRMRDLNVQHENIDRQLKSRTDELDREVQATETKLSELRNLREIISHTQTKS